jgi:membrane protease YdiL (CAAX protease family)
MLAVILKVMVVLVIALFLTISTVAVVKLVKIDMKNFQERTGAKFMSIALIANLLFILAVYVLLKGLDGKDFQSLGFSMTFSQMLFSILALFFTMVSAYFYVLGLSQLKLYDVQWALEDFIKKEEAGTFFLSFMVLFVAALQEEVMFRGYLSFLFHPYGFTTALLLSTIIFTVWHFIGNKVNRYQVLDWFIGGLILFYVYMESGSIWVAAIVHFSRNLSNVLVYNIAEKYSLFNWNKPIAPKHKSLYIVICSLLIALLTGFYF